ncbi:MAG: NUDIX domain-containing protein [Candidatus Aureabacteria bacterium]|nr:NUDIX domain-containing protein [Candidatus Auribacterota bacterium]
MGNETREVMVVDRGLLLAERTFQGYVPPEFHDYESVILGNYRYVPRAQAEVDPNLKQPVAYCAIVNPRERRVFAYRRATAKDDYAEERLRGKWSIGIGGHIDPADRSAANPVRASLVRELAEELVWEGPAEPRLIGYINDDRDMVGKVHFGLLYRIDKGMKEIRARTGEIAEARMVAWKEWEKMMRSRAYRVEGWSRIVSEPLSRSLEGKEG